MSRYGMCGPSYATESLNANAQSCINWYLEHDESGSGKSEYQLYPTPGTKVAYTLTGGPAIWELMSDGTVINRGTFDAPTVPISFAANQANQMLVCNGGKLWLYDLSANTFAVVNTALFSLPVSQVSFIDGYFVALLKDSNKFQISGLLDGSSWSGLDVNEVSIFPDKIVSLLIAFRMIWLLGAKNSAGYWNTGALSTPFLPASGAYAEQGAGAQFATVLLDNAPHWLGKNPSGSLMAFRANGYTPQRVSNHAIENEWQTYSRTDDAIGFPFQMNGHSFWHILFPTANKSWRYDAATQMFHEVRNGSDNAHVGKSHCFGFGKHFISDNSYLFEFNGRVFAAGSGGTVYQMSIPVFSAGAWSFVDDAGSPIIRVRRAPYIASEGSWVSFNKLEVETEPGMGPMPPLLDGTGLPRGPEMSLRWSDDGAHTWSNYYPKSIGQAGEYKSRLIWRRLGRCWGTRGRIFELSCSDPHPYPIIDSYIDPPAGRLSAQLRATA